MRLSLSFTFAFLLFSCTPHGSLSGLLTEPVSGRDDHPYTAPAYPVQTEPQICKLDLSAELFGGVSEACGRTLDRSRCCPVLAAWLFAAHARWALQLPSGSAPASISDEMPMMPDDAQKCADSLETALVSKNVHLRQPNSSCDTILCFCGIRLHQISSLSCPAAFNVSSGLRNATPTAAVRSLEKSCRNSSYAGCTRCIGALQKLKGEHRPNETTGAGDEDTGGDRARKMFDRDCQLMGLTWLLARNKTEYIPTVSAVLRAIMYSAHPPHGRHQSVAVSTTATATTCSPDQENMPLAVDSLELERAQSSSSSQPSICVDSIYRWIQPIMLMTMLIALSF